MSHGKNKTKKKGPEEIRGSKFRLRESEEEMAGEDQERLIRATQGRIVEELLVNFTRDMKAKLPEFPLDWDGFEIRHFFSDYFLCHYVWFRKGNQGTAKKLREYQNVIRSTNLL